LELNYVFAHLFVKTFQPGNNEVIFSIIESSCPCYKTRHVYFITCNKYNKQCSKSIWTR